MEEEEEEEDDDLIDSLLSINMTDISIITTIINIIAFSTPYLSCVLFKSLKTSVATIGFTGFHVPCHVPWFSSLYLGVGWVCSTRSKPQ